MTIFGYNMKRIFGRPLNLVFMVLIPVVLNILIISLVSKDVKYTIGIRDLDNTVYTKELVEHIQEMSNVVMIEDGDSVNQMVIDGDVDIAMEFAKGYTDSLIRGNDSDVLAVKTYSLDKTNATDSVQMYVRSLLEAARQIAIAANGNEEKFYDGMDTYYLKDYQVEYDKFATSVAETVGLGVQSLGYVALGIAFLMMFATGLIQEDKLTGVYDRINVTPLSLFQYYM
ncbi:MAG: ABC transporter permease [Clostridium sp.]|nr:ABC transporter permease [Clostridium sp.]